MNKFITTADSLKSPEDLLIVKEIRPLLITAANLKPAGAAYIDEAIFRYLLIKGDTLGGVMRNRIGKLAQERLIRMIFSVMNVRGITCDKIAVNSAVWTQADTFATDTEKNLRALHWKMRGEKILIFNAKIPTVNKNVDLCLFAGGLEDFNNIVRRNDRAIMFGELKGGIDPAGADEHWKTGNSALNRIRTKFAAVGFPKIKTAFIAAALMLIQLAEFCNWLIDLRRDSQ